MTVWLVWSVAYGHHELEGVFLSELSARICAQDFPKTHVEPYEVEQ